MNSGLSHHGPLRVSWAILPILILLMSAVFLAAQATFSAGPLLLHEVRTIYVAPSSDDFVLLVKARLEKWRAIGITSKLEEADAIHTLVDRRSQKPIWRTIKSAALDGAMLADDIMAQLKQDWRKSVNEY